jgi:putative membrane protein
MPSEERRLHPLSVLFGLLASLRSFALPALFVVLGAGSRGWGGGWELWALPFIVPSALLALFRYLTLRYRFDDHELVIRSGVLFRSERHVPYARIQNLDGVQNVLHRMLGMVEVRVETGGGQEPEATLRVLSLAALEEVRRRVAGGRAGAPDGTEDSAGAVEAAGAGRVLFALPLPEVLLCGLIEGRGSLVLGAAFGLLWEVGLVDRLSDRWLGETVSGRGLFRALFAELTGAGGLPVARLLQVAALIAGILLVLRLASVAWALVRLYGFRLTRTGDDLQLELGLFTRVTATIPLRRIQTVTVSESPFHRLFGRVSVRVETAGGGSGKSDGGGEGAASQREWLAPLLPKSALPVLLAELLPEVDLKAPDWQSAPPRAFRRELKGWLLTAVVLTLPFLVLRWGAVVALVPLLAWAVAATRGTLANLGWAVTDTAVLARSGWLWRRTRLVRFSKIQAVALHESPFDRRAAMARLRVDTAGAGEMSGGVEIPYLPRATAGALAGALAAEAARTSFRW